MSLYGGMNTVQGSNSCLCDLRSDTMTAPNEAMRAAMASAVDGDMEIGREEVFGPVLVRSDAIECIWVRLEAFGHFRKFRIFDNSSDDVGNFWMFFDLGGLLLCRNTCPGANYFRG